MDGTTAYLWHGRLYTLEDAPADLLAHLQERGLIGGPPAAPVGAPTLEQGEKTDYPTADVATAAGVGHLTQALAEAGFLTAVEIAQASEDELTAVSGIGKATAAKLWSAAQELLAQEATK